MDAFDLVAHDPAKKAFREGLRVPAPIALRSNMHRDDIEDVDIVVAEDLEVAATRQVLKIDAGSGAIAALAANADRTGEIDAADVLEVIALPACVFAAAWPADDSDEDDAFFARDQIPATPISTQSVSIDLDDERVAGPGPRGPQRRLGWVVGIVLSSCVALLIGEAIAGGPAVSSAAANAEQHVAPAPLAATVSTVSSPSTGASSTSSSIPTLDVRSLPAAAAGTIVSPSGLLVVDGKHVSGSERVVACGRHIVRTSRTKARPVEVPCGARITIR